MKIGGILFDFTKDVDNSMECAHVSLLHRGDSFAVVKTLEPVKVGDQYRDYPAVITEIIYEPKKWWQFWKKPKQLGYIVEWRGDDKKPDEHAQN